MQTTFGSQKNGPESVTAILITIEREKHLKNLDL
jgi:hypothetical protein